MTSIDYAASTKAYRRHKAAVTRLRNKKEWTKVIAECELAFEDFDKYGWVDNWAMFVREAEDALFKIQREYINGDTNEEPVNDAVAKVDAMRRH